MLRKWCKEVLVSIYMHDVKLGKPLNFRKIESSWVYHITPPILLKYRRATTKNSVHTFRYLIRQSILSKL